MPKIIDPNLINVGEGSSKCNDHARGNNSTQINMNQDAYDASQISAENPFETYLGDEAQSHFDDLASQVKVKPPRLGEGFKTYSFGALSQTHSGTPDWGVLKQADSPIWNRKSSITFEGVTIADTASHFLLSAQDTYGYNLTAPTPYGFDGADPRTDGVFNVAEATLLGAGEGASFLSSVQKGSGKVHQHARVIPRDDVNLTELSSAKEGFTVSGFLFPADRGTLALLRWENIGTTNLVFTPASSVADIKSRVVAAVNLSVGLNDTDAPIFLEGSDQFVFPSKLCGQYDLYEMQTGKKRADLSGGGTNIADLQANKGTSLGSVRLLREANACYFGDGVDTIDSVKGHLPVLGGAYSWDGASWVESATNFLAYRLPMLASYEPSHLTTPTSERQRFFSVVQPASTTTPFTTAGGYVTFGEDHFTFQVARFRQVVDYSLLDPSVNDNLTASKGSYALVHFKTEDAFENLVRDGIQPSEDDLWSVNFLNAKEAEHMNNVAVDADGYSDTGVPQIERAVDSISNPLVRPNVHVLTRNEDYWYGSNLYFGCSYPDTIAVGVPEVLLREQGYFTSISGVKYLVPKGSIPLQRTNYLPEMRNRIAFDISSGVVTYLADYTDPHYLYSEEEGVRKFNDPFDIFHISIGSMTSDSSATIYSALFNGSTFFTKNVLTQHITIRPEDRTENEYTNTPAHTNRIDLLIYPDGDTGFCSFSEGVLSCLSVKDPTYHYDGFGTAKTLLPNQTGFQHLLTPSKKVLYHSSRLYSLIESAPTKTMYLQVWYQGGYQQADHYFSIFRYDQEGFRVYQTLDINAEIEDASGGNPNVPYPIYRASSNSANYSPGSPPAVSARFEAVEGEKYYVEYGAQLYVKRNNQVNLGFPDFLIVFGTQEEATANGLDLLTWLSSQATLNQANVTFNMTAWDRLGLGTNFGLSELETDSAGNTTLQGALTYSAFLPLAFDVNSFDLHEVEAQGGELTYGNFVETATGIIAVQGLSTDTTPVSFLNAYDPAIVPLERRPLSSLFTARKDTQERFLDESYRIDKTFSFVTGQADTWQDNLTGTGLPLGSSPVLLSVRDDSPTTDTRWDSKHGSAGYLRNALHWRDITAHTEAQVRGLPIVADAILSGGKYGQPRRGVLTRPTEDYNTLSYIPSEPYDSSWQDVAQGSYVAGQIAQSYTQPNYSAVVVQPFTYVRAFDVSFSQSGAPENMEGTSRFLLRVVGLEYNDFKYLSNVPNPADDRGVEIYVKVPGLTTWLDVGRDNDSGPSKQHISQDGAGCLISYQEGILVEEGLYCTDLELEVGGNASFFTNSEGECPVLVKVVLPYNTKGTDGSLTFGHAPSALATNTPFRERRGLVGIEILRMSTGENFDRDEVSYL